MDITLCISSECPLRDSCHRFTCPPSEWQSYAAFFQEGEKCSYYWPAREKRDDSFTTKTEN